jgi:CHRD domain-containing protein
MLGLGAAVLVAAGYGFGNARNAQASPAATPSASAAVVTVSAKLRGSSEPTGGDPDGTGTAQISLNVAKGKACWSLQVQNIGKPLSAHIHKAKNGFVIIPLGSKYSKRGCVVAPKKSIRAVASNPSAYYVNVHTNKFLNGAVRGQLHR